jgi:hypothetical protein
MEGVGPAPEMGLDLEVAVRARNGARLTWRFALTILGDIMPRSTSMQNALDPSPCPAARGG